MTTTLRWAADLLRELIPGVEYIDRGSDRIFTPPRNIYRAVEEGADVTIGSLAEWSAVGLVILYVLFLIVFLASSLRAASPILRRLTEHFGYEYGRWIEYAGAAGIWAVLLLTDTLWNGRLFLGELHERFAESIAVYSAFYISDVEVEMGAFLIGMDWWIFSNPQYEFGLLFTLTVTAIVTAWWYFYTIPENLVILTPVVTPLALLGVKGGTVIFEHQIFPISATIAFLALFAVLWLLVITPLTYALDHLIHTVIDFWPNWNPQRPPGKNAVTYSALFLVLFGIFADPIVAIFVWVSVIVQVVHGGTVSSLMKMTGRERQCMDDPETGEQVCEWTLTGGD